MHNIGFLLFSNLARATFDNVTVPIERLALLWRESISQQTVHLALRACRHLGAEPFSGCDGWQHNLPAAQFIDDGLRERYPLRGL